MPITRNTIQTRSSLEEFYLEITTWDSPFSVESGHQMLEFLKMINETFKETQIWGLTSHARLVIQAEDGSQSDWLIIVACGSPDYYFEYRVPKDKAPWKNATINGTAQTLDEAKTYLLIAMRECQGWQGNSELQRLQVENRLA